jgi:hypothetical protein
MEKKSEEKQVNRNAENQDKIDDTSFKLFFEYCKTNILTNS